MSIYHIPVSNFAYIFSFVLSKTFQKWTFFPCFSHKKTEAPTVQKYLHRNEENVGESVFACFLAAVWCTCPDLKITGCTFPPGQGTQGEHNHALVLNEDRAGTWPGWAGPQLPSFFIALLYETIAPSLLTYQQVLICSSHITGYLFLYSAFCTLIFLTMLLLLCYPVL